MAGEPHQLGPKASEAIGGGNEENVISAVVIWEVAIKRRLEQANVDLLAITARHADRVGTLPTHHQDPFDRLLVAQAEIEGATLVSADAAMLHYEVEVVW
jgi:PIN domain nuclease of toxin-antitoxin system